MLKDQLISGFYELKTLLEVAFHNAMYVLAVNFI